MKSYRSYIAINATLFISLPSFVYAEAVTDSSWGRTPQTLTGQFTIPQALGKLSGSNLFHSFEKFNIKTGESATFTTSNSSIANVITRVSGNNSSIINGLLKLQPL
jgi:large exoprotein involved in heme utilization and adhesion